MNWHKHTPRKLDITIMIKRKGQNKKKTKERVKGNGSSIYIYIYIYIYSKEVTRNRTTERAQTRSRWSTGINRERIEETIKERRKKITDVS